MFKIVFIDLDGTLLNSEKRISDFDKKVLKQLSGKVKIVFASARSFDRIFPYIQETGNISDTDFTLAFNGGLVTNNTEKLKLADCPVKPENLEKLISWINGSDITGAYAYGYKNKILIQDGTTVNEPIYKIVVSDSSSNIEKLKNIVPDDLKKIFEVSSSEAGRIDFVEKGMTKKQAIIKLLNHLNIDKNEMIAIGDGENDISMIKMAKVGIAMGNAGEEVKKSADIVTDTNDNCGVGKILERLLLQADCKNKQDEIKSSHTEKTDNLKR